LTGIERLAEFGLSQMSRHIRGLRALLFHSEQVFTSFSSLFCLFA